MTADQYITIAILALTFALLIKSKIPPVAVFVGALTLTITFHLAPLNQSLKGFSNPGMLTVGALLMVAAGMYRTGAITLITEKLIGLPKSLLAAQAKILPPVAVGSAFLNNTPLVAMFIPVIRDLAKISRLPAPRLYIPLSFASILGGTCTLIGTSTNLVVAGMVIDFLAKGDPSAPPLRQIAMFDLAWIGLPATVAGIVFMMLTSRFLLPGTKETDSKAEIMRLFGAEFKVTADAPIIGKSLQDMGYINPMGFQLLVLKRNGVYEAEIRPQTKLEADDVLVFSAMLEAIPDLWETNGLEPVYGTGVRELVSARHSHRLVEVVVSRRALGLGRKIKELPLPEARIQGSIIAISRGGKPIDGSMSEVRGFRGRSSDFRIIQNAHPKAIILSSRIPNKSCGLPESFRRKDSEHNCSLENHKSEERPPKPYAYQPMVSGAGHDAGYMNRICPTAMIFEPSIS